MGFSTVFASLAFIFIFIGMAVFAITTQKNITLQASEQAAASERQRIQQNAALSIMSATYGENIVVNWTTTTYADFAAGTLENTTVQSPGTLVLVGPLYNDNGTWTSPVIDTGTSGTNYTTISWTAVLPMDTALAFQARAGTSVAALEGSSFTGPDGTTNTVYVSSGTALNTTVHDETRYLQYRAYLGTTNSANTPQLQEVQIGIRRPGGVASITVRNTGNERFPHADTDVYIAGERVPRNTSSRTRDLSSTTDQVLWLPGESVTYSVFTTISTPAQVTVANGAARAGGVVN